MVEKPRANRMFLVLLAISVQAFGQHASSPNQYLHGAMVRGDTAKMVLALVFTGDEYADGGLHIARVLDEHGIQGSFFLTGKFYRNPDFAALIGQLRSAGHYLGAHSDQHLLYCDWDKRDSLLVTREEFERDLDNNYLAMRRFGISKEEALYFLPPFEWYNDSISAWASAMGLQLVNFTHGTLSHADYTLPGTPSYRSSQEIYDSILAQESKDHAGLRGFILLSHVGTARERTDKFYLHLEKLIISLKQKGYEFRKIDQLLHKAKRQQ
jgi:endoglucanase